MSEPQIGVLAIQGDFAKHLEALNALQLTGIEVRSEEDLNRCSHLIIPGGESTTVGKLLQRFGLGEVIKHKASEGMPIWGTCMGMIMLARKVESSDQYSLGLLDIEVRRNAFGRQVHSFEDAVPVEGFDEPVTAVFIRAPIVTKVGEGVSILSRYQDAIVGVRQGKIVGTSFHPELTSDTRFHAWFASL